MISSILGGGWNQVPRITAQPPLNYIIVRANVTRKARFGLEQSLFSESSQTLVNIDHLDIRYTINVQQGSNSTWMWTSKPSR